MTIDEQDWKKVKLAIHSRGMTLSSLAEIHNMTTSNFTALRTKSHSKAEKIIADFLDQPVDAIFPNRYPKRKRSCILDSKVVAQEKARKAASEKAAA